MEQHFQYKFREVSLTIQEWIFVKNTKYDESLLSS